MAIIQKLKLKSAYNSNSNEGIKEMAWKKQGRVFYYNEKEMFSIKRQELENTCYNMTPCQCDAMGYFILEALQNKDFEKYYDNYMKA